MRQLALTCLVSVFSLVSAPHAQIAGKPFLEWLRLYSPTGYFIIHDYETRANKPGDHTKWELGTKWPLGAVAVHESGHMRNLDLNSKNGNKSYYIGDFKDYVFKPDFTAFYSSEILEDIPQNLRNFQTEVYIQGGPGNYSVGDGMVGLMEEWDQYITGLKSGTEMAACYKANFNTSQAWNDLANDVTTSVWSNAEFRYFILRYVMTAKAKHKAVYDKIVAGQGIRQNYTYLVAFAEKTMSEWQAVLTEQKMDTKTGNGFDWHWKFWNEIQKPEYKELEKLLLIPSVSIAPRLVHAPQGVPTLVAALREGRIDLLGRNLGRGPGALSVPGGTTR